MHPPPFTYIRPESLEEALDLLAEHGNEAVPLAGGQSLLPFMKLTQLGPSFLVDISRLVGLDGVHNQSDGLRIGPLTRHAQVAQAVWPIHLAILGDTARVIADVQVRNRGTVGGSLAYADPAGDWSSAMLALGASVTLRSKTSERNVLMADFFTGEHETAIAPGELLSEVAAPQVHPSSTGAYVKLARRHGDYAVASVAVQIDWAEDGRINHAGIGMGGVGDTPIKAGAAEVFLQGRPLDASVIAEARELVMEATEPHSDFRGTAQFRKQMAGELFTRALNAAQRRKRGEPAQTGYL
jgi:carbon-monoxide dehydrogenase medium subunit